MDPSSKRILRVVLSVTGLAAIVLRNPGLFLQPRFWAEEAVYYAFALSHPWYTSLLSVRFGYFALWPNLATTIAAHCATLLYAPLVTTLFALAAQLFTLFIVLWGESDLWRHPAKIIAAVLILLFTPLSSEVWLNTINSQFYLAVATFLVLSIDIHTRPMMKWGTRILLGLAGLTGPVSCFLMPLFFIKRRWERNRERLIQGAILVGCVTVQIAAFLASVIQGFPPARSILLSPSLLASIFWTQSLCPLFLGTDIALMFGQSIIVGHAQNGPFWGIGILLLVTECLFFSFVSLRLSPPQRATLLGSYLLFMLFSINGGLGTAVEKYPLILAGTGSRYFFAPNVVLLFLLLTNMRWEATAFSKVRSVVCVGLLSLALVFGMEQYHSKVLYTETGPNWKEEVRQWQSDSSHALKIWPLGWQVRISPAHR